MSVRRWHYVKSNANSETMQECIFIDTETGQVPFKEDITGHVLRFGWAAHCRRNAQGKWTKPKWKHFTDYSDLWLWAMTFIRKRTKIWVWIHNSNFDYPVLHAFTHLPELGFDYKGGIMDAPPTIMKYRSGKSSITLCDTLNIWRMPLWKLGIKVGLEKLKMPAKDASQEAWDEYAKRDVEIIIKAITEWSDFLRENDMGGFFPTIAGQAMKTFRHKYMRHKILIDCNEEALSLARNCYHGGRVECGYIGHLKQPVYYLDVNSMYPFVMSYAYMPVKIVAHTPYVSPRGLRDLLNDYCVCAKVRLNTDEPFAAVVDNGKLKFPIGKFDAYLSTPELEYALNRDYVTAVYRATTYERAVCFREFAIDLYQRKQDAVREGRIVEAEQWKLLLNSFYGKWGQNGFKWVDIGTCDKDLFTIMPDRDVKAGKNSMLRYFGGVLSTRVKESESRESHPAIAATITAHARMILWTLIRELAPENYFYCDTDAVLTSEAGFCQLHHRIDNLALGALKHVKTYKDVFIYGCKDYVLDGKRRLKGIRDKADQINETTFRQVKWYGLAGLLRAGSIDMPLTIPVTKTLSRVYDKGVVMSNGYVRPLHFPEESSDSVVDKAS